MTLEACERQRGHVDIKTTACPFCEEALGEQVSLAKHLRGDCELRS